MKWWSALGIVESRGLVRTYWLFCESMSMLSPRSSSTSFCLDLFFLFPPLSSSSSTLNTASTLTPFICNTVSMLKKSEILKCLIVREKRLIVESPNIWGEKKWYPNTVNVCRPVCCYQRRAPRSPLLAGLLPSWRPPRFHPTWTESCSGLKRS